MPKPKSASSIRFAAVGDIHCTKESAGRLRGFFAAAGEAADALERRFGTGDPAAWREPRRLYDVEVQGVAPKPRLEAYDRGTWQQVVALGP